MQAPRFAYTSVYAYPWDVLDEGPDRFCQTVRDRLGIDTVSLAVSYHAGKLILPRNPRRRVYYPEDGALYFRPDPAAFAGLAIQPHVGVLARETDALAALCAAAARAGLGVIAWTVCLHNTRLGETYPQFAPRNAFDDVVVTYLCPAQPAVRAYVASLFADLARRYSPRAIQLEAAHHMPFVHGFHHEMQQIPVTPALAILLGLCFCPACLTLARAAGVDGPAVRRWVVREAEALLAGDGADDPRAWLSGYWRDTLDGELGRYLDLRAASVDHLLAEVYAAAHAAGNVPIHLQEASAVGAAAHSPVHELAWQYGMKVPPRPEVADGVTVLGYFADNERFRRELAAYRARIPTDMPMEVGLHPCLPDCASAEELAARVDYCASLGANAVSFYNYGMMPVASLDWVRAAVN